MVLLTRKFMYFDSTTTLSMSSNPSYFKCVMEPTAFAITDPSVYYKFWINSLVLRNDFYDVAQTNCVLVKDGVGIELQQGKPSILDVQEDLAQYGIHFTYSSDTNKITFSTAIPYTLDFTSSNSCAEVLGFIEGQVYTITDGFEAPFDVTLGAHDVIYVKSNNITQNYEIVHGDTQFSSIMVFIPNLSQPYEIINHSDPIGEMAIVERNRKDIQSVDFALVGGDGKGLTLNSPWNCSVCIEYHKDYEVDLLASMEQLNQNMLQLLSLERRKLILESMKDRKEKLRPKK